MGNWFHDSIVETGRLPLFCFFCGFVAAFLFIRFSVRAIRAKVRWWFGNVKPGGIHVHHVVPGVLLMLLGGVGGLSIQSSHVGWLSAMATVFGVGSALVLDEFAVILHLDDVYWKEAGRTSIDAVFAAIALTGLILLRVSPVGVDNLGTVRQLYPGVVGWLLGTAYAVGNLVFVVATLLKGKIWTGLLGVFVPGLAVVGAVRLSRPDAPWARWRYRRRPRSLARAQRREASIRRPMIQAKIRFQEFVSGKHDLPDEPFEPPTRSGADTPARTDGETPVVSGAGKARSENVGTHR
ncbi:MAG: hypothetical protein WCA46_17190 [Actinocatenispora sp.]